ncbi:polysaccharide export outer membrane protein [Rhizobiales bacterium GAS113]|nr:polysaccharide export outer membrane protein [Rhizobiales bacterium GAS113]SEF03378.1 polysaccharide export outer membrane protein [Rhizobiales bacterium GAS188]
MTLRTGLMAVTLMICGGSFGGCINSSGGLENRAVWSESATPAAFDGAASNSGQIARAVDTYTAAATPGNAGYKVGPQDVLDVSVFQVPELTRSVQVSDIGTVNLPLVGEVAAAGKTSREIERDLASKLGAKYVRSPQVTVFVKEYNSQRVTVEGAVKKPGVYPVRGKNSLTQFIAMAEGLDHDTASSTVVVFRSNEGKRYAAKFDIKEIMAGRADDPPIQQDDIIVVDSSTSKEVFSYLVKALPAVAVFSLLQ